MSKTKLAIATTTIETIDNLLLFINFHKKNGITHFYIFVDSYKNKLDLDDNAIYSTTNLFDENINNYIQDTRKRLVEQLNSIDGVKAFLCDEQYYQDLYNNSVLKLNLRQSLNATHALSLADKDSCTHLAHIDFDELIYSDNNHDILTELRTVTTFTRIYAMELVPENIDNGLFEGTLFRVNINKSSVGKVLKDAANLSLITPSDPWFRGYDHYKSIYNIKFTLKNKLAIGVHSYNISNDTLAFKDITPPPSNLKLLHFQCANFRDFKQKLEIRTIGEPPSSYSINNSRRQEIRHYRQSTTKQDLIDLYKNNYFIDDKLKDFLLKNKALTRITIDKNLFLN